MNQKKSKADERGMWMNYTKVKTENLEVHDNHRLREESESEEGKKEEGTTHQKEQ